MRPALLAATLGLSAVIAAPAAAQFNTPSINCDIGANKYGLGNANNYASGTPRWYMTWDDTYLYVSIQDASEVDAGILYIDWDPILPVNGGGLTDGTLAGLPGFYGLTPDLPFRSDAALLFRHDSRELYRRNGIGGGMQSVRAATV